MASTKVAAAVTMRSVAQIDFFYDIASPYSWIAFETLMRYRCMWNAEISLRPFFLGGVMKETGNKPPATLKAKRLYMMEDLQRMARYHGVPLVPLKDKDAMYSTLGAQRLLTAVSLDAPEQLENVTRALWLRLWGGGGDIAAPQGLQEACVSAGLGSDVAGALLAKADSEDAKCRLKAITDEALKRGAFGAPWITLEKKHSNPPEQDSKSWHTFWGCDRFDVLAETLGQPWFGPMPPPPFQTEASTAVSNFTGPPPLRPSMISQL